VSKLTKQLLIGLAPKVDLIELFCCKFTHIFCKLDRFKLVNFFLSVLHKDLAFKKSE
jgi:hypothetical protein